jgi:hypothetical protein
MKKRTPILILAVVLALSLLTITAFANAPTYEGYEAFKALMENKSELKEDMKNGTLVASVTLQEEDELLLSIGGTVKADGELEAGKADIQISAGEVNRDIDVFFSEDIVYVFDEVLKEYYSIVPTDEMKQDEYREDGYSDSKYDRHHSGKMTGAQEELLDFLVGELKDDFSVVRNSDESQTISFELTTSEMPMLLNLLVSAGNSVDKEDFEDTTERLTNEALAIYPLFAELSAIDAGVPVIEKNFKLNLVKFSLTVDRNQDFKDLTFSANVSGEDSNGVNRTQQVDARFELSDVGSTALEAPVLEGKTIISIDPTLFEHESRHYGSHRRNRGGN